jgi:hypothetical protein
MERSVFMFKILSIAVCVLMSMCAWAQMPHEVLLLVNKQSQPSMRVANTFAAARQIPERNIVYLDIPDKFFGIKATISPEQFTKLIWEPANAMAKEQGIDQQILAWVYSVDFPIRIKTDAYDRKQMSVGGLTFMRNRVPDLSLVEEGTFLSKLFAGPNDQLKLYLPALSLGMQKNGLGEDVQVPPDVAYLQKGLQDDMPLPNMMLGYVGQNGNDVETVLETIQRGVTSDHRGLRRGIYFVVSEDVRSKCREWQYEPAVNELKARRRGKSRSIADRIVCPGSDGGASDELERGISTAADQGDRMAQGRCDGIGGIRGGTVFQPQQVSFGTLLRPLRVRLHHARKSLPVHRLSAADVDAWRSHGQALRDSPCRQTAWCR